MAELILIIAITVVSIIIGIEYMNYQERSQERARKGDVEKDEDVRQQEKYIALAEKYLEQDAAYRIAAGIREKMPCQQHVYARTNIEVYARTNIERLRQMPPGPTKDDFVHYMIRNGEVEQLREEVRKQRKGYGR